jgi:hypothetical protein
MRGTNIRYISELEMNKVKVDNCPKFEAQLGKCFYTLQVCYTKYIYLLKPFSHHSKGIFKNTLFYRAVDNIQSEHFILQGCRQHWKWTLYFNVVYSSVE